MFDPNLVHHAFVQQAVFQHAAHQLASSSGVKRTSVAEWDYVWGVWGSSVGIMGLYAWRTLRRGRRLAGALSPVQTAEASDGQERSADR